MGYQKSAKLDVSYQIAVCGKSPLTKRPKPLQMRAAKRRLAQRTALTLAARYCFLSPTRGALGSTLVQITSPHITASDA